MRNILIILLFFFNFNVVLAQNNIVYLDVNYILDNSNIGKIYNNKIQLLRDEIKLKLELDQKKIKEKEAQINNQKNILKKEEIDKKINELNDLIKNYQKYRKNMQEKVINDKRKYSTKILNILNPLLTNFVEKNKINLVVEKKNILVGVKTLDITDEVLKILNDETIKLNINNDNWKPLFFKKRLFIFKRYI